MDDYASEVDALSALLSFSEGQQANKFVTEELRQRYIISHGGLRLLLSRLLSCDAKALRFQANDFGKPYLEDNPIYFNMSHANNQVLYGFSKQGEVGVDIEYVNRKSLEPLALGKRFFSPNEYQKLKSLKGEALNLGFFRAWTGKEALLKAMGVGIAHHLADCEVSLLPDEKPKILRSPKDATAIESWKLHSFIPCKDYLAAVAYPS